MKSDYDLPGGKRTIPELNSLLQNISDKCYVAVFEIDLDEQQQQALDEVAVLKSEFIDLLNSYTEVSSDEQREYLETLDSVTYDLDKIATRFGFGIKPPSESIPQVYIMKRELDFDEAKLGGKGAGVNATRTVRVDGKRCFFKGMKPFPAQLEIVAAEFYAHSLGRSRTSHGRIVAEDKNIAGMYVEGVPGFISMRQLSDLAKDPNGYKGVESKISDLGREIKELNSNFELEVSVEKKRMLRIRIKEKENLKSSYEQVRDLGLLDIENKLVNISKIASSIASALTSAFFMQDWDRHKDNFGISFADGKLGVASLDYDKSLTGIFGQGNPPDWSITPQRLRDFPGFKCHYWPSHYSEGRKNMVKSLKPRIGFLEKRSPKKFVKGISDKVDGIEHKMYGKAEAAQYAGLKYNTDFISRAQIEWMKLIFIPVQLRERSIAMMTSSDCDPKLIETPAILDQRRIQLLKSVVQLKGFREGIKDVKTLGTVKGELRQNLSDEEFAIVERNWSSIESEVTKAAGNVETLEEIVRNAGQYQQLLAAIERIGISFSSNVAKEELGGVLNKIGSFKSSSELKKYLNENLGLDLSKDDARMIRQEVYARDIIKRSNGIAGLKDLLEKKLIVEGGLNAIHGQIFAGKRGTKQVIEKFESALHDFIDASEAEKDNRFNKFMKMVKDLGLGEVITRDDLRLALSSDRYLEIEPSYIKGLERFFKDYLRDEEFSFDEQEKRFLITDIGDDFLSKDKNDIMNSLNIVLDVKIDRVINIKDVSRIKDYVKMFVAERSAVSSSI